MDHNNFSKNNDSNKDETSENISEEIYLNDNSENDSCIDDSSKNILEEMKWNNNTKINDSDRVDLSNFFHRKKLNLVESYLLTHR